MIKIQFSKFKKKLKIIAFKKDDEGNLTHESNMPPHVERFLHIYEYLRKSEAYDWVVTTDVKDVIFQGDPCKFVKEQCTETFENGQDDIKHDFFASESMLYKDEHGVIKTYLILMVHTFTKFLKRMKSIM